MHPEDNHNASVELPLLGGYGGESRQVGHVYRFLRRMLGAKERRFGHRFERLNKFAWKVRGFSERQCRHANQFAWEARGFIEGQCRHVNQFAWRVRSFGNEQLDAKIWLSWKFWTRLLIVVVVCILGAFFLSISFREPWTTADYTKLEYPSSSIRVLHIRPGSGKQGVECTMESVPLDKTPHYDALSYTWGPMIGKKSITVNGKKMDVTKNLYEALLSIRLPKETRTVWADQICIDQSNMEEKNSQVPLMTLIYSRASDVLIWLGYHKPPRWVEKSEELDWAGEWAVTHASLYPQAAAYWLYLLSEEEYWKRCWIVQEIGMASSIHIHIGSQSIPWGEFIKLINWFRTNHRKANVNNILKLDALRQSMYLERDTFSFAHLLTDFYDSFCSVKLDKVFAFVGMANECRNGCIDVDYNKPLYSVYEDFITFQNLSSEEPLERRIDMAYDASVVRQNLERESSSRTKTVDYFGKLADPNSYIYDACGDERGIICSSDPSRNITSNAEVKDRWVGAFRWLFRLIFRPRPRYEAIWLQKEQESAAIWLPDNYASADNHIQVQGLITNAVGHIGPLYSQLLADPHIAKRWANEIYFYSHGPDRRKARGLNERFMSLLSRSSGTLIANVAALEKGTADNLDGPRLFLGSEVMIGILPSNAMVGDLICQFWSSNAAAIIRLGTDSTYHVIGRALIVQNPESFGWDVPRNRTTFRLPSSNTVDLTLDLNTLTRLTLDSVDLGE